MSRRGDVISRQRTLPIGGWLSLPLHPLGVTYELLMIGDLTEGGPPHLILNPRHSPVVFYSIRVSS